MYMLYYYINYIIFSLSLYLSLSLSIYIYIYIYVYTRIHRDARRRRGASAGERGKRD